MKKGKLRIGENGMVYVFCPACKMNHPISLTDAILPKWDFNGDYDNPTFSPSLLLTQEYTNGKRTYVCHSFIRNGKFEYLNDCTHEFAGQTIEIE